MSGFRHIGAADAAALIAEGKADVVDIRDVMSFGAGHIPGARHLTNTNLPDFLAGADRRRPVIVCCYHGHSSQDAAEFLIEHDFAEVYSLDGGIETWRCNHPVESPVEHSAR